MKFCPACGAQQPPLTGWPHVCPACQTPHFCSPKPVVALVLNAWDLGGSTGPGKVLVQRGIEPHKGTWAFPGGYIDHAEDWRHAAAREAKEELGVELDPDKLTLWHSDKAIVVTPTNFLVMFVGYSGDVLLSNQFHRKDTLLEATKGEVMDIQVSSDTNITLGVPAHDAFWKSLTAAERGMV